MEVGVELSGFRGSILPATGAEDAETEVSFAKRGQA